jgi:hypothetical protein
MTRRTLAATVVVAAFAVAAPAQGAVDLDDLNPPPPDFYTCTATGSGAVCHGTTVGGHEGEGDGSCPQGFDILEDAFHYQTAKRVYNRDGDLVERVLHDRWPHDPRNIIYNSVTGKSVPYWGSGTERDTFTVPGDFDSMVARTSGNGYTVTVPGAGLLIKDAGRLDFGSDGGVTEMRGPKMLFLGETEKLCAALAS